MNYLKTITVLLFFAFSLTINAQKGEMFPALEGETLTNQIKSIPADINNKYTIIGMAWSKKSEEDLESWLLPVYDMFIGKNTFMSTEYDVNVLFIPMFSGIKKGAYKTVMKKSKEQLDPKLYDYVLFYKGSVKDYRAKLNLEHRDVPYFFVLDKTGKIVYVTSGKFSDSKLDEIENVVG